MSRVTRFRYTESKKMDECMNLIIIIIIANTYIAPSKALRL